jgi:hypothetical protein
MRRDTIETIRRMSYPQDISLTTAIALARAIKAGDLIHVDEARALVAEWDANERAAEAVKAARGVA